MRYVGAQFIAALVLIEVFDDMIECCSGRN